jgi:outer membrane protein OmpA-like peptidoglycan-associated protein
MYTAGMKAERNYNYVGAALRFDGIGTFGLSWLNAGITGIPTGADATHGPTGTFDVSNNAFQLNFARTLGAGFALGIGAKYLQEDLANNDGYGVDAGLLFKPWDEVQFGAMVRDIAGQHGDDDVPFEARLGVGAWAWRSILLTTDLVKVQDQEATAAIGGAFHFDVNDNTNFYVAAGMNDIVHDQRAFTAGMGLGFKSFAVQYAYVTEPESFLQENHRLSVNFYFGDREDGWRSKYGSLKRAHKESEVCCKKEESGPKEFIHRYIFEGNPSLKLSLELLKPEQKDSIKAIWSETGGVVSFPGVNFATGSADITDEFARVLDGAAQLIGEHPEIQLLEIQGHTDNTGSDAINNPLSQARADAVRNYLISRGVDPTRLTAKGYGSSRPVSSNATEQGRYQNRRIDIVRIR